MGYNKDLCRSFLFMWDMMIITRNERSCPIAHYIMYRDGAAALFQQLFNKEMGYPYEIERGMSY